LKKRNKKLLLSLLTQPKQAALPWVLKVFWFFFFKKELLSLRLPFSDGGRDQCG
jgi:hypothetical protein